MRTRPTSSLPILLCLWLLTCFMPAQAQTNCAQVTQIPQVECAALLDFFTNTDGANWVNNTGWNVSNTPCTDWFGVSCSAGRVSRLALFSNQLSGPVPESLSALTNLASLDLFSNQLSGTIPDSLSALTNLTFLSFGTNQLSGPIPDSLSTLTNLTLLSLNTNRLSGPIPDSLSALTNLTILSLFSNQLSGPIPSSLSALTNLTLLSINTNQLSGSIPDSLGALTNLTTLSLDVNQLSGPIPLSLMALVNIPDFVVTADLEPLRLQTNLCLTATDTALINYLNAKNPSWQMQSCNQPNFNFATGLLSLPILQVGNDRYEASLTLALLPDGNIAFDLNIANGLMLLPASNTNPTTSSYNFDTAAVIIPTVNLIDGSTSTPLSNINLTISGNTPDGAGLRFVLAL